jgi:hypothetical protein
MMLYERALRDLIELEHLPKDSIWDSPAVQNSRVQFRRCRCCHVRYGASVHLRGLLI